MVPRKFVHASLAGLCVAGLCMGGYLAFLQFSGNFHTVVAGQFYRSAQPSASQLEEYVTRYGIRTVINLRGSEEQSSWYRQEIATAKQLGVEHIDFEMSASREVTPAVADQIVSMLKSAPKPILIHCKAGSDRSGIVSAIYSHSLAGMDEETAEGQLSIYFGHIGIPYLSSAYAMDESWEILEDHWARKADAQTASAQQPVMRLKTSAIY